MANINVDNNGNDTTVIDYDNDINLPQFLNNAVSKVGRRIIPNNKYYSLYSKHFSYLIKQSDVPSSINNITKMLDAEKWIEAYQEENKTFIDRNVYTIVDKVPIGAELLNMIYLFKKVYDTEWNIKKYKVRCVIRGDQQSNESYNDTYAPNVDAISILTLLCIAQANDWHIQSVDIKCAFVSYSQRRYLC